MCTSNSLNARTCNEVAWFCLTLRAPSGRVVSRPPRYGLPHQHEHDPLLLLPTCATRRIGARGAITTSLAIASNIKQTAGSSENVYLPFTIIPEPQDVFEIFMQSVTNYKNTIGFSTARHRTRFSTKAVISSENVVYEYLPVYTISVILTY